MELDRFYLELAMREAETAFNKKTYPVGAVIVGPDGEIISRGHNHVYDHGDYTSHAEMEAIRVAGSRLMREENLRSCTLYTTLEPCLMCCGAILHARIAYVVWLKDDDSDGALRCLHRSLEDNPKLLGPCDVCKFRDLKFSSADAVLGHVGDLKGLMDNWMECWKKKKEGVRNKWRQDLVQGSLA